MKTHDSNTLERSEYVLPIVFMIIAYWLAVQGIFGWLYFIQRGDSSLVASSFRDLSISTPIRFLPHVIAVLCIGGLLKGRWWAWWLTVLALGYELVTYLPGVAGYLSLSAFGAAGLFKLAWLAVLGLLLYFARQRGT